MPPPKTRKPLPQEGDAVEAVLRRHATDDADFVYGVRTTGVFCRPDCAARRPARKNIVIFADANAARLAGYRPCKRCRPEGNLRRTRGEAAVWQALDFLEESSAERITLEDLACETGLSPFHLQRAFRRVIGLSPREYLEKKRMQVFKAELRAGHDVLQAGLTAGYESLRTPYSAAATQKRTDGSAKGIGMTPGRYRRGGENLTIQFRTGESTLGRLLLARTPRGICALYLGDDDAKLEAALREEFPRARLERNAGALAEELEAALAYVAGRNPRPDLTLDLIGTEFQLQVWQALQAIPYGETRSYQELAAAIGRPQSARAAARAVASNRIALLIPCHRVVRSDGSLSGYRWNPERKRLLLEREGLAQKKDRRPKK